MRRWSAMLALCTLAAAATALPGCGHCSKPSGSPQKVAPELPIVARQKIDPDVSALPLETDRTVPSRPGEYRDLTAAECRRLAIKNAPFADDLDGHPDNRSPNHPRLHPLKPSAEEADVGRRTRGYL